MAGKKNLFGPIKNPGVNSKSRYVFVHNMQIRPVSPKFEDAPDNESDSADSQKIKHNRARGRLHLLRAQEHIGALLQAVNLLETETGLSEDAKKEISRYIQSLEKIQERLANPTGDDLAYAVHDDLFIRDYVDTMMAAIEYYYQDPFSVLNSDDKKKACIRKIVQSMDRVKGEAFGSGATIDHRLGSTRIFDDLLDDKIDSKSAVKWKSSGQWFKSTRKTVSQQLAAMDTSLKRFHNQDMEESSNPSKKREMANQNSDIEEGRLISNTHTVYSSTPDNRLTPKIAREYAQIYLNHYDSREKTDTWFEKCLPVTVQKVVLEKIREAIIGALPGVKAQDANPEVILEQAQKLASGETDISLMQKILEGTLSNTVTNVRLLGASNAHFRDTHSIGRKGELFSKETTVAILSSQREHKAATYAERLDMATEALRQLILNQIKERGGPESFCITDGETGEKKYHIDVNFYSVIEEEGGEKIEAAMKEAAVKKFIADCAEDDGDGARCLLSADGKEIDITVHNSNRSVNGKRHLSDDANDRLASGDLFNFQVGGAENFKNETLRRNAHTVQHQSESLALMRFIESKDFIHGKHLPDPISVIKKHLPDEKLYAAIEQMSNEDPGLRAGSLDYLKSFLQRYTEAADVAGLSALLENIEGAQSGSDIDMGLLKKEVYKILAQRAQVIINTKSKFSGQIQQIYNAVEIKKSKTEEKSFGMLKTLRAFFVNSENDRLYYAALRNFSYNVAGGVTIGGCHSGKDRTSMVKIYTDAIQNISVRTGKVPDIKNKADCKEVYREVAFLIATEYYTKIAEMNCRGCAGMKSILSYIPDGVIKLLKDPAKDPILKGRIQGYLRKADGTTPTVNGQPSAADKFCSNLYASVLDQDYASRLNEAADYRKSSKPVKKAASSVAHGILTRSKAAKIAAGVLAVVFLPVTALALASGSVLSNRKKAKQSIKFEAEMFKVRYAHILDMAESNGIGRGKFDGSIKEAYSDYQKEKKGELFVAAVVAAMKGQYENRGKDKKSFKAYLTSLLSFIPQMELNPMESEPLKTKELQRRALGRGEAPQPPALSPKNGLGLSDGDDLKPQMKETNVDPDSEAQLDFVSLHGDDVQSPQIQETNVDAAKAREPDFVRPDEWTSKTPVAIRRNYFASMPLASHSKPAVPAPRKRVVTKLNDASSSSDPAPIETLSVSEKARLFDDQIKKHQNAQARQLPKLPRPES